jgi:hypothetical protein
MGLALWTIVQGQIHDLVDGVLRDRLLSAATLPDLRELDQPILGEPGAPPLTEAGDTDNARAMAVFARPSAAISSALARTTSRCVPDCDRANDSSTSRCPADISSADTGCLMAKS